jgi:transcriptional regulator with GAF, ATPase, and Fis domain
MRVVETNVSIMPELQPAVSPPIVAESAAMRGLLAEVRRVASKDITVLVRGETGTGKELVTSLLHAASSRASAPLVRFNCAAISAELADAELFGHARGAYTGAGEARQGYFAAANGGTVVLDEVGELPLSIQAKLLRVLQNGEIQRVGASRIERVDVRVIACTNRDLATEVSRGRFRADLYYRLAVVELVVPALCEHREDIPALAMDFARRYAHRFGCDGVRLSPGLLEELKRRDWPGNVRELENAIARMLAFAGDTAEIGVEALGRGGGSCQDPRADAPADRAVGLREQVDGVEKAILVRAMDATLGNQSEAARVLRVSRTTLIEKLRKHGLLPGAVARGCAQEAPGNDVVASAA